MWICMYFYDYQCAMNVLVESLLYEYLNVCQMLSGCGCEVIKYKNYLERSRIFVSGSRAWFVILIWTGPCDL